MRIYQCRFDPLYFGRTGRYRFDDPEGQYGVMYVAGDEHCAFVETLGQSMGVNTVTMTELGARCLCQVTVRRPLRLVNLTDEGLGRIGADGRLTTGDYSVAQMWSRALHDHPDRPDGILYRSRRDPSRLCAALYDHIADLVQAEPRGSMGSAANEALLAAILDTYDFGLIDDSPV